MTSQTLKKTFDELEKKKKAALITYTVAGDPDKKNLSRNSKLDFKFWS